MNARVKLNLIVLGLSTMTTLCVVGSTAGTLAWYAYNTNTTIGYHGTSVKRTERLQVGLVDEKINGEFHISNSVISAYNLTIQDLTASKRIVWAASGSGLVRDVITNYVSNSEYRNNNLSPVSSRRYDLTSDNFNLYGPIVEAGSSDNRDNTFDAPLSYYVKIPFVFKKSIFFHKSETQAHDT